MVITPVLLIDGQKFLQHLEVHLEFFAVFQNFYLFVPRLFVEPLTMFCGTVVG